MAPTNRGRMSGLHTGRLHAPDAREDDGEAIAVVGRRVVLNSQGPANALVVQPTQLISLRTPIPRQWVITLAQATPQGAQQQPWRATFDGTGNVPIPYGTAGTNFSAPVMPTRRGVPDNVLQCALRWGAGGIAFETLFDYPPMGVSFGVTADVLDLNVQLRADLTTVYASADQLPVVGAFAVPGVEAEPTPLRWAEAPNVAVAVANSLYYAVKPYSRRVRVTVPDAVNADVWTVRWRDANGSIMWKQELVALNGAGIVEILDVPSASVYVELAPQTTEKAVYVEWEIGLT